MAAEKNAAGVTWSSGPYVRKGERDLWNSLYEEFTDELRVSADYPGGVKLSDGQVHVLAYNCAYRAIWLLRKEEMECTCGPDEACSSCDREPVAA